MKFKFTTTPLKDIVIGTEVDGYTVIGRSPTGKNAIAHRGDETVLLVYTNEQPVAEIAEHKDAA